MVRISTKGIEPQDFRSEHCFRIGETSVWSICFWCGSPHIGVTVRDQKGKYSMECKCCGYSAVADYEDPVIEYIEPE